MIVLTYVYRDSEGTKQMADSVKRLSYELAPVRTTESPVDINRSLYECYKRAQGGHDTFIYSDAADTYFQKAVNVPDDRIIYSTEKNCFPNIKLTDQFPPETMWRFLNGGGYCGSLKLIVEFFERYGMKDIVMNGQEQAQLAYLKAKADGFPIELDTHCNIFQSIAFEAEGEFTFKKGLLYNKHTKTTPSIIHGNGTTSMKHIYNAGKA